MPNAHDVEDIPRSAGLRATIMPPAHSSFSSVDILPAQPYADPAGDASRLIRVPKRVSSARLRSPNSRTLSPSGSELAKYFADFSGGESEHTTDHDPPSKLGSTAAHTLSIAARIAPVQHRNQPDRVDNSILEMSDTSSSSDPGAFHHATEPGLPEPAAHSPNDPATSYDLQAPLPQTPLHGIEHLAERLFSTDHLNAILRDAGHHSHFNSFLAKYRPQYAQLLSRYADSQKAISAIAYANAIADALMPGSNAAALNPDFAAIPDEGLVDLCDDALAGYVTFRMVQLVTETLVKEITGQNTPMMRDMVRGLAEVYCLTDPSLPDNPIVYASEEFFRCTQYGREYSIGRNCRFLQGPRSSHSSIQRLVRALEDGQETCETILNYRRDGSPFINLLMIAPLYDNRGQVRYFIGAQIDISGLLEGGRGMESLQRLLQADQEAARYGSHSSSQWHAAKSPQDALSDLSKLWGPNEHERIRRAGHERADPSYVSSTTGPARRRYLGVQDPADVQLYPPPHLGPSGRLPGVFQNYLLVRPYPSLRITFTSPALRIPGLLQSKFMDRVSAPQYIKEGIFSALSSGVEVTAKINWLVSSEEAQAAVQPMAAHIADSTSSRAPSRTEGREKLEGKTRWIHCTPLLSSENTVGVWMVVMVENESITGALNHREKMLKTVEEANTPMRSTQGGGKDLSAHKLYQQYLRREGRNDSLPTGGMLSEQPYIGTDSPTSSGRKASPSMRRKGEASRSQTMEEKVERARMLRQRAEVGDDVFRDF